MTKANGNMPKLPLNGDCVPMGDFCHLIYTSFKKEGKRRRGGMKKGEEKRREGGGVMSVFFSFFFKFSLH